MKEQVEICIQGGIAKAYESADLLKIQAVYVIPSLKDSKTKQKKEKEKQELTRKTRKFDSVLKDTSKDLSEGEISCQMKGYTKDAKSYSYLYESKTYGKE